MRGLLDVDVSVRDNFVIAKSKSDSGHAEQPRSCQAEVFESRAVLFLLSKVITPVRLLLRRGATLDLVNTLCGRNNAEGTRDATMHKKMSPVGNANSPARTPH